VRRRPADCRERLRGGEADAGGRRAHRADERLTQVDLRRVQVALRRVDHRLHLADRHLAVALVRIGGVTGEGVADAAHADVVDPIEQPLELRRVALRHLLHLPVVERQDEVPLARGEGEIAAVGVDRAPARWIA
jgi:hypothetical protein